MFGKQAEAMGSRGPAAAGGAVPIRILHLLASLPVGGAEDLVTGIVQGLNPERFTCAVACIGPPGPVGRELQARGYLAASLGLEIRRTPSWRLVAAVRRLLKEWRPDILHTHLYHPSLYGRLAALGLGLSGVVASVHNSYTRVKLHRRAWNFALGPVTDRILVASPQVWQDVRIFDGIPASRLLLLPYGISMAELETSASYTQARGELQVSGFVIGAVGRLEEQKGHVFLLQALADLSRAIPDLTLLLVGEGRQREALERQAGELGIAEKVQFLGTRRDLPLIYRALDLFVQPSLWEGLPLALLKAMGAGRPAVATRVSGVREVIADGVNGRLVAPGDAGALAGAILAAYKNPARRAQWAAAARETVKAQYSQEAMLARLEELYLELGQRGRQGA